MNHQPPNRGSHGRCIRLEVPQGWKWTIGARGDRQHVINADGRDNIDIDQHPPQEKWYTTIRGQPILLGHREVELVISMTTPPAATTRTTTANISISCSDTLGVRPMDNSYRSYSEAFASSPDAEFPELFCIQGFSRKIRFQEINPISLSHLPNEKPKMK